MSSRLMLDIQHRLGVFFLMGLEECRFFLALRKIQGCGNKKGYARLPSAGNLKH